MATCTFCDNSKLNSLFRDFSFYVYNNILITVFDFDAVVIYLQSVTKVEMCNSGEVPNFVQISVG